MFGREQGSNCGDVCVDYLQHPHRMRRLMKDQYAGSWTGYYLTVQYIRDFVLACRWQSGGSKIDRAVLLLICPIKDTQNALPVLFFEKEHARLLILSRKIHQIPRNLSLPW